MDSEAAQNLITQPDRIDVDWTAEAELFYHLLRRKPLSTRKQPQQRKSLADIVNIKTQIEPRSRNQSAYLESIFNNTFTFGVGLAGTGKTLLATWAAALELLDPKSKINRIVVVRPVIGNKFGENFGALPGTLMEKMMPYGSSVIDNLSAFMDKESINHLIEKEYIEFIPLTLLRGRSLNNAFVIVEEAQNIKASSKGVYMVMSRLGPHAKMVFNGDLAQSDLGAEESALDHAMQVLSDPPMKGCGIIKLNEKEDVQRNPMLHELMVRFGEADENPF